MFCFKKALCLTVSTCVQFYHQEPLKHLFCIVRIKKKERKDIPQKKYFSVRMTLQILTCFPSSQSCNFFLGKSRVNMSCSLRVRNRRLRTCQANTVSTSFLRTDRTGPCSSQSRIMFRAAVRLSVSGVRGLTRTQPGSRGNS